MRFQVPQFIEIEQKIIGGVLTMRQFITMAIGAGVLIGLFYLVNFFAWIILAVIIGTGIFAVSFLKINGRSLSSLIKAAFYYYWNPSFYLWRVEDEYEIKEPEAKSTAQESREEPEESVSHIPSLKTFTAYISRSEIKKPEAKPVINEGREEPEKKVSHEPSREIFRSYSIQDKIKEPEIKTVARGDHKELEKEISHIPSLKTFRAFISHDGVKKPDIKPVIQESGKESEERVPLIPSLKTFRAYFSHDEVKKPEAKPIIQESREEPAEKKIPRTPSPGTFRSYSTQINRLHIDSEKPKSKIEIKSTPVAPMLTHKETRDRLKIGDQIQSLWEKISTSKTLVPKRESHINAFQKERIEAGYQAMRRASGEIEVAKRVDFK